eukprot:g1989.t1
MRDQREAWLGIGLAVVLKATLPFVPRPMSGALSCTSTSGMPSGHAAFAASIVVGRLVGTPRARGSIGGILGVAGTVLVSRYVLRYHSLDQILAGVVVGVVGNLLARAALKRALPGSYYHAADGRGDSSTSSSTGSSTGSSTSSSTGSSTSSSERIAEDLFRTPSPVVRSSELQQLRTRSARSVHQIGTRLLDSRTWAAYTFIMLISKVGLPLKEWVSFINLGTAVTIIMLSPGVRKIGRSFLRFVRGGGGGGGGGGDEHKHRD